MKRDGSSSAAPHASGNYVWVLALLKNLVLGIALKSQGHCNVHTVRPLSLSVQEYLGLFPTADMRIRSDSSGTGTRIHSLIGTQDCRSRGRDCLQLLSGVRI